MIDLSMLNPEGSSPLFTPFLRIDEDAGPEYAFLWYDLAVQFFAADGLTLPVATSLQLAPAPLPFPAARRLFEFFTQYVGYGADWPVRIEADEDVAADLCQLLTAAQKEMGVPFRATS